MHHYLFQTTDLKIAVKTYCDKKRVNLFSMFFVVNSTRNPYKSYSLYTIATRPKDNKNNQINTKGKIICPHKYTTELGTYEHWLQLLQIRNQSTKPGWVNLQSKQRIYSKKDPCLLSILLVNEAHFLLENGESLEKDLQ